MTVAELRFRHEQTCRSGMDFEGGAACRNRTDDLFITSETLYRLS